MRKENYLFIADSEKKRNIYRIMPYEYLLDMFTSSENVLPKPESWDDPFEHFLLKSQIQTKEGKIIEYPFHEDMYAQCWSLENKSDALWRIYTTEGGSGIRVRTSIEKLADGLSANLGGMNADLKAYIGKVKYLPNGKMVNFARSIFSETGLDVDDVFKTLLMKRPAFKHEREVRLMYQSFDEDKPELFRYGIDVHDLVDQIMINPLLDEKAANQLKEKIRDETGYTGSILRSMMYQPPKKLLFKL